ncbi:MAG TPA: MBL fold metallo-hydrolase [Gammaproteobacteria bacterium]|nr:MBL fold metallo-hydrolase [Gammaproteobacteria bacterium]HJP39597.1 MBL fold metallo-hydrolase [Gammaproteobacteria bacterium]
MHCVAALFLSCLVLMPGVVLGQAASVQDVPLLFPGSKNPMKKWQTERIAEGVYGFRYTFYRNIFIVTDEGVIATDPMNAEAAAVMRREIRQITPQPVRFVSYSHSHWDHVSGGKLFKEEGASFVAQKGCAENFVENPHPDVVVPDITYGDRYEIELGGKSLEMLYFGPSHDSCLVVMVVKPANLLFMVDTANPPDGWAMFYNPAVSEDRVWHMVPFFSRVQALVEARGIKTVIGAHMTMGIDPLTGRFGIIPGTQGPATVIAERLAFWSALIDVVRAELAQGASPGDVPDRLVERRVLAEQISGYEPEKMHILLRRITSYAITGE